MTPGIIRKQSGVVREKEKQATAFSQLTYLLHIVTSLNSNDNLKPGYNNRGLGAKKAIDPLHSLHVTVLDSIAAILVQQHEVVAACFTSDAVSVMVAETNPIPSDNDDVTVLESGSHVLHPLQLAAISNPDFNPTVTVKPTNNSHNLQILANGKNLWTSVRDLNKWYCVLM